MHITLLIELEVNSGDKCAVDDDLHLLGLVGGPVRPEADEERGRTVGPIFVLDNDGIADAGADSCLLETSTEHLPRLHAGFEYEHQVLLF